MVKQKVLVVFGTRPEAIKMAPVILELKKDFKVLVCITSQHKQMLHQILDTFDIKPDFDLNIMRSSQDLFDITSNVLLGLKKILMEVKPCGVLVHGDTTTTMATAIAAFYSRFPVAHVEAGLRTYDMNSPYPEEFNRQIASKVSAIHFAPTEEARQNLLSEKVLSKQIFVTGNTVIDALFAATKKVRRINFRSHMFDKFTFLKEANTKMVLVTGHRRENFGDGFKEICNGIRDIALNFKNCRIVYPVHLNPNVQEPVKNILCGINNIHLIKPLDYLPFVFMMDQAYMILTDSGGIQEEAPSLGKPVLVMRETTERPEAVASGNVKLVGACRERIFSESKKLLGDKKIYDEMSKVSNPYGDGKASKLIRKVLIEHWL